GASVVPSPSEDTNYGRSVLADVPDHTGSLGIAISEAIEDTVTHPGTKYSLGSVFDFVLLHQTVIGQEAIEYFVQGGRGEGDPVQPVRPRPFRPVRLRALPVG